METLVNMHEAKTTLSQLVEKVNSGSDIILAKNGVPVASIVPYVPKQSRNLGRLASTKPKLSDSVKADISASFNRGA